LTGNPGIEDIYIVYGISVCFVFAGRVEDMCESGNTCEHFAERVSCSRLVESERRRDKYNIKM